MRSTYAPKTVGRGTKLQSSLPKSRNYDSRSRTHGLLSRGVVVATYVTDDATGHPALTSGSAHSNNPQSPGGLGVAIYCDVLLFPSIAGSRWCGLRNVLVSQERSGIHRGNIWKPRAATVDVVTGNMDDALSNPANLDGDHVLIGFLDDAFDQPVILRSLPHPSSDKGNENYSIGTRTKLKLTDGDPEFWKHHGVFWGVDNEGNHIIDSTFANDGTLAADGSEAAPPVDSKGTQTRNLPKDATHNLQLWDMSNPAVPVRVAKVTLEDTQWVISFLEGATILIDGTGPLATMTLGDGAVAVAVADHLETLYAALKLYIENAVVTTGTGPSSTIEAASGSAPSWDSLINSNKLTIPDTTP